MAAVLAAAVFLLTGCMRLDMQLTVQADDTVDGSIVMAFSDEIAEMLGSDPASVWDEMGSEMEGDLPPGATQEPYSQDGYTGTRVTFTDVPLSEMTGAGADELMIWRDGDEFVLEWDMDTSESTGELDGFSESFLGSFDVRVSVTFPGAVSDHNGTLTGRTVTWEPTFGEASTLRARAAASGGGLAGAIDSVLGDGVLGAEGALAGGGGFPWLLVLGIAAVVGLGVLTAIVLLARSRRTQAAGAPGAAAYQQGYPQGQPQQPAPPSYPQQPGPATYPQQPGPQPYPQPGQQPPGGEPPAPPSPPA